MKTAATRKPMVSVILPVYNADQYLNECLASIVNQSLSDFELVCINDGSTDKTMDILQSYQQADDRIKILNLDKVGLVTALNRGCEFSKGEFLARMDGDDIMHLDRLKLQFKALCEDQDLMLISSLVENVSKEEISDGYRNYLSWLNSCVTNEQVHQNIFVESPFAHPTVMIRRDSFFALGEYRDGEFPEDYDLWLRASAAGWKMEKIKRVLHYWRDREDRLSRTDERYSRRAFDVLRAKYLAQYLAQFSEREIVIWGAGRITRLRTRALLNEGVSPSSWIDIDAKKIGKVVWGMPVYPAEYLNTDKRPFVLIYVARHGAREEIAAQLEKWGYESGEDYLAVG